jgi:cyclohexanone monooxygenase
VIDPSESLAVLILDSTESFLYRYSWDAEDLRSYPWPRHYVKQEEVLAYLQHVVKKHNLRKDIKLNTTLLSASWDDSQRLWVVETSTHETIRARYLVTALGLLSKQNFPKFKNLEKFQGGLYHTGAWPENVELRGKRVGVIGNGSTGIQVITSIAKDVKQLICFQRSPQYSVPSGDMETSEAYRDDINKRYDGIWKQAKNSAFAFGFEESTITTMSVSKEKRQQIFEDAWQKGNGFRFMFGTFCDISYDEQANEEAASFIRQKIKATVTDPEKARKLTPTDFYARRPLCDTGYYQQFNREHVDIVDLKANPIQEFTANGIKTADGTVHELDIVVCATGFDAVDGNYTRVAIKGQGGKTLKAHWEDGPTSYLGVAVSGFPNLFTILGPNGPFTNLPPTIETQVEFISNVIEEAEKHDRPPVSKTNGHTNGASVEHVNGCINGDRRHPQGHANRKGAVGAVVMARAEAEIDWTEACDELSRGSLFRKTDSWIFGANIPGKKNTTMFYFGGLGNYRKELDDVIEHGYRGFQLE